LVTGGAVRIGRAVCEALAARGCEIVIHYNHSSREATEFVGLLSESGTRAHTVQGELGSAAGCGAVARDAWRKAGGLDVLINNAAIFLKDGLMDSTEPKLMEMLRVNTLAPIHLTRAFASLALQERGNVKPSERLKGKIVNLLDQRITTVEKGCLPYALSKKALSDFTGIAALELAPHITVNGVAPGAILSPPGEDDDCVKEPSGSIPMGLRGSPDDIADAVIFLLESDAITGQVIYVDGGQHLLGNVV